MPQATENRTVRDIPIGLESTAPSSGTRSEFDSMGTVEVPSDRYWGAQTQRSLEHFSIGNDRMPKAVYHAYGYVKKAAALVNHQAGRLPGWKKDAIVRAADETINGALDEHNYSIFIALSFGRTGSGTQSNMNVNEVIANRAIQLLGGTLGSQEPVGPNDDVNMGQSSNDTFPTAMHIASVEAIDAALVPEVERLADTIERKANGWMDVVKIGRTHLEDAVPLTVGQEWHGWAGQIRAAVADINASREGPLCAGGRWHRRGHWAQRPCRLCPRGRRKNRRTYRQAFHHCAKQVRGAGVPRSDGAGACRPARLIGVADEDRQRYALAGVGTALRLRRAIATRKRAGFVNHAWQGQSHPVRSGSDDRDSGDGNDTAVAFAGSQGNFELNAMRPVIINNFLHSARILADGCARFREFSVEGTELNRKKIDEYVQGSVMLVTALSPIIGYQNAAHIAEKAIADGTTLREAALASGKVDAALFDKTINPLAMVGHGLAGA